MCVYCTSNCIQLLQRATTNKFILDQNFSQGKSHFLLVWIRTEQFLIGTWYLCDLIPQNVADTIGMKRNSRMKNMKGYLCEQPLLHHVRRDEKQTANVHCVLKRIKVNWGEKNDPLFCLC